MAIQYKPTKQKKEKTPKAPKAEKPIKVGVATKVKTTKPAKEPKTPKAPKPEKVKAFAPAFRGGKVEKTADLEKKNILKKNVNPVVAGSVILALIVVTIVAILVFMPAMEKNGEEISEINVARLPEKTVYLQGEEADYRGLRITVTRKNGETFVVRAEDCTISGFSSEYPKDNMYITVDYEGVSCSFTLDVLEHQKPTPVLDSIYLESMPKTEYKVGELFSTTGGVLVRKYKDGSLLRVNLTNLDVYGWSKVNGPGKYTLTVKYAENGVLCTFDYEITVTE